MFKLNLERTEEPEIKLPTSVGATKKQENSRETSTSSSLITLRLLTVWIKTNCGKFLKRWEYQTISPASWEICMKVKKLHNFPLPFTSLLFSAICKASLDNHFAFCISFSNLCKVRTRHETTNLFQIGKGVCQDWILSPRLFNLYAEYIMRNARLDEAQAGIKIAGRNINKLRYADNTTFTAKSKEELRAS